MNDDLNSIWFTTYAFGFKYISSWLVYVGCMTK
jgi:hypothetical protein